MKKKCKLTINDMKAIARFNKIVKNYIKIMKLCKKHMIDNMRFSTGMELIKHGYALSDSYFEGDNPIAVEEGE